METMIIDIKSKQDKSLFYALAERLHLRAGIISPEDKENYALLKAMMQAKKNNYVSKEAVLKALRK